MQKLYFVPLTLIACATAHEGFDADESTLLQVTTESRSTMRQLMVDAEGEVNRTALKQDANKQFDAMYSAVAELVAKQKKAAEAQKVAQASTDEASAALAQMIQEADKVRRGSGPFDALNDAFDSIKDKAAEAVDKAKDAAENMVDNLNNSAIGDLLGDDVLKKAGDLKDQFTKKLDETVGKAMNELEELKDKVDDAKDEQVLKLAKSLAKAGDITEKMAAGSLEKLQGKMDDLKTMREELDKITSDEQLADAKTKLEDQLGSMAGLLSVLNSVAHTNIDYESVLSDEGDDVKAKVDAAKGELDKAMAKAADALSKGQQIDEVLKSNLGKIDELVAKMEAKDADDKSNNTDGEGAENSLTKTLLGSVDTIRKVIQGKYDADADATETAADAETPSEAEPEADASDTTEKEPADTVSVSASASKKKGAAEGSASTAGFGAVILGITTCILA